jgi:hypothetical protein
LRPIWFPRCSKSHGIALAGGRVVAQASAPSPASVDARRLEISEELSESLANDLLELSVVTKNRDLEKTAQFFPEDLTADAFPSEPTATKPEVKWPLSVVIDPNGRVEQLISGWSPDTQRRFEALAGVNAGDANQQRSWEKRSEQ